VEGLDDAALVADHVRPVGQRAPDGEDLSVGLLRDHHEVALRDVTVGVDDARAHDVGAVRDELDCAGVDSDDPSLGRERVGPLDGEERFAVEIADQRGAVQEDDVSVDTRQFDLLEGVGVDRDPEVRPEGLADLVGGVRPEMVARLDLHTCWSGPPSINYSLGSDNGRELETVPPPMGGMNTEATAAPTPGTDAERVAILAHGRFPDGAKTAVGLLRYSDYEVVAVLDREIAGISAGARVRDYLPGVQDAPIVADTGEAPAFDALVVGIAPVGGGFENAWRPDVRAAVERGADLIAGLHYPLSGDEELARLAAEHGVDIWDVREPPGDLSVGEGTADDADAEVVLTVGTDCSTGKMTTTMALREHARERGLSVGVVPTGQTGIMIEGWGVAVDRTVADYAAGATERMVLEAAGEYDYLIVEGQGSITHPAYSGVTASVLHGAMPDALVLCHAAGRDAIHSFEGFPISDPGAVADLYERVARPVSPAAVVAGALNTRGLDDAAASSAVDAYADTLEVPAADPVRDSPAPILDAVLSA